MPHGQPHEPTTHIQKNAFYLLNLILSGVLKRQYLRILGEQRLVDVPSSSLAFERPSSALETYVLMADYFCRYQHVVSQDAPDEDTYRAMKMRYRLMLRDFMYLTYYLRAYDCWQPSIDWLRNLRLLSQNVLDVVLEMMASILDSALHFEVSVDYRFFYDAQQRLRWQCRQQRDFSSPRHDTYFPWWFPGHHARFVISTAGWRWASLYTIQPWQDTGLSMDPNLGQRLPLWVQWLKDWVSSQELLKTHYHQLWYLFSRRTATMLKNMQHKHQSLLHAQLAQHQAQLKDGILDPKQLPQWMSALDQMAACMQYADQKTSAQIMATSQRTLAHIHDACRLMPQTEKKKKILAMLSAKIKLLQHQHDFWRKMQKTQEILVMAKSTCRPEAMPAGVQHMDSKSLPKTSKTMTDKQRIHYILTKTTAFLKGGYLVTGKAFSRYAEFIEDMKAKLPLRHQQQLQKAFERVLSRTPAWTCRHQLVADLCLEKTAAKAYFMSHWRAWILSTSSDVGQHQDVLRARAYEAYYTFHPQAFSQWIMMSTFEEPRKIGMQNGFLMQVVSQFWSGCTNGKATSSQSTSQRELHSEVLTSMVNRLSPLMLDKDYRFVETLFDRMTLLEETHRIDPNQIRPWVVWRQLVKSYHHVACVYDPKDIQEIMRVLADYGRVGGFFMKQPYWYKQYCALLCGYCEMLCVHALTLFWKKRCQDPLKLVQSLLDLHRKRFPQQIQDEMTAHCRMLVETPTIKAYVQRVAQKLSILFRCKQFDSSIAFVDKRFIFVLRHQLEPGLVDVLRNWVKKIQVTSKTTKVQRIFGFCERLSPKRPWLLMPQDVMRHINISNTVQYTPLPKISEDLISAIPKNMSMSDDEKKHVRPKSMPMFSYGCDVKSCKTKDKDDARLQKTSDAHKKIFQQACQGFSRYLNKKYDVNECVRDIRCLLAVYPSCSRTLNHDMRQFLMSVKHYAKMRSDAVPCGDVCASRDQAFANYINKLFQ